MAAYTNRAAGIRGGTVPVTVRLPLQVVEFMDAHRTEELHNRSDILQHAAVLWCLATEESDAP